MDLRLQTAILLGKTIALIIKYFGGGATAAPGLYALKIDKNLVKKMSKQIEKTIVISGTNGKTTTARIAAEILSKKYSIVHNRQGSNLLRGIASTLITNTSIFGKIDARVAIWEADEAALPSITTNTNPNIISLLNLFRDQLDRYGEVDTIKTKWKKSLSYLNKDTILILNADDPGISYLGKNFKGKTTYFGVEEEKLDLPNIANVADILHCPNCNTNLNYSVFLLSHLGHYNCPKCDFKRPQSSYSASGINFKQDFSTKLKLNAKNKVISLEYNLPGLYNVYNLLAASTIANQMNIDLSKIKEAISTFEAAFGRFQKVKLNDVNIIFFLIKNPTGANEVLRTIAKRRDLNILAILNDNIADGKDVSWIWDSNWEIISGQIKNISVSGTRAWDLATRFKYAGIKLSKDQTYEDINYSVKSSINSLNNKNTLLILPTYTALLQVQKSLKKLGASTKWHTD